MMSIWSDFPKDVLGLIFRKLPYLSDHHRFASVCKQWRSVALENNSQIPPQPPILMLPYKELSKTSSFFSLSEKKYYKVPLPELSHRWCCGSSLGWLLTIDDNRNIALVNPFSRVEVNLPRHPLIPTIHNRRLFRMSKDLFICKVALSASPLSSDCIVAIILSAYFMKLSFCKIADGKWITLESPDHFQDIIWYEGRICATSYLSEGIFCEATPSLDVEEFKEPNGSAVRISWTTRYLVESCGELLLIIRHVKTESRPSERIKVNRRERRNRYFYRTTMFEVYKLKKRPHDRPVKRHKWIKVKTLGDQSLLLGGNQSIAFFASDFPQWRKNCIYFTDDYLDGQHNSIYGCHDSGVFNLDDQKVEPFFRSAPFMHSPALWLTLN